MREMRDEKAGAIKAKAVQAWEQAQPKTKAEYRAQIRALLKKRQAWQPKELHHNKPLANQSRLALVRSD